MTSFQSWTCAAATLGDLPLERWSTGIDFRDRVLENQFRLGMGRCDPIQGCARLRVMIGAATLEAMEDD